MDKFEKNIDLYYAASLHKRCRQVLNLIGYNLEKEFKFIYRHRVKSIEDCSWDIKYIGLENKDDDEYHMYISLSVEEFNRIIFHEDPEVNQTIIKMLRDDSLQKSTQKHSSFDFSSSTGTFKTNA